MKEAEMTIPHLFRCPISLDLFTDPVTLCTGQTYDRSGIEKWLAAGNLTCPVTMQKLKDPSMVPNHTLRHLIEQWIRTGHQFDPDYFKHNLKSHDSTLQDKLQTLEKFQALSEELLSENSCLIQLGFFPLLLEIVFRKTEEHSQENFKFLEQALVCALKLLPLSDLGSLNMLKEESSLAEFLALFEQGTAIIKRSLCYLVEAISSSSETEDLCAILAKTSLFQRMVHLLHDNDDASEAAIKAISALSSSESNRESLVREGAVEGLVGYILSLERRERSSVPMAMAMATVEVLLRVESGKESLILHPNGVNALVKMVFRVSDHEGSESAVNSLMIVCCDSLRAREEAVCSGVLSQLLLLLQSQCDERTKTKARMLLKLLR